MCADGGLRSRSYSLFGDFLNDFLPFLLSFSFWQILLHTHSSTCILTHLLTHLLTYLLARSRPSLSAATSLSVHTHCLVFSLPLVWRGHNWHIAWVASIGHLKHYGFEWYSYTLTHAHICIHTHTHTYAYTHTRTHM